MRGSQDGRRNVRRRGWRFGLSVVALGGFVAAAWAGGPKPAKTPKGPVPEKVLDLEGLGFPGVSPTFLAAGGSMLTVHFVDADHLLLTFSERGLVPREKNDPPDDEDRMVAAELIEVTSGRVVAKTEWHLHDHGRYLWNLGDGRFLLRIREELSTFAPMANLASGHPFVRTAFRHRAGTVEGVALAADNKLLTLLTSPPANKTLPDGTTVRTVQNGDAGVKAPYTLDFYRLSGTGALADPVVQDNVGAIGANSALTLPIDGDGYLWPMDQNRRGEWTVAFEEFGGKEIPLAPVPSTCPPALTRVGAGQLVALACRGTTGRVALMAYDFEKHEMWEEPLNSSPVGPTFAFAAKVGRFAISRLNSVTTDAQFETLGDTQATQEVRVYQTQTGDLLLKIDCTPVFKSAENFDLAPDGRRAVVIREGALEVFPLPALTALDIADLAELQKVAPPVGAGRISLSGLAAAEAKEAAPVLPGGGATQTSVATVSSTAASGEGQAPRKAPTLLNPGEKAEFEEKKQ